MKNFKASVSTNLNGDFVQKIQFNNKTISWFTNNFGSFDVLITKNDVQIHQDSDCDVHQLNVLIKVIQD